MSERVLIVSPVFTHVEPDPYYNMLMLMLKAGRDCPAYQFDIMPLARRMLHSAMNDAAQVVLEQGHVGMIVLDDDCFPPHDAIPRLLAHAEAGHEYVAGVGVMRAFPHTTTVGRYFPEGISLIYNEQAARQPEYRGFEWVDDVTTLGPPGLHDVDFCGVPIAYIARSLLARITPPWFGTSIDGGEVTHDVYFARKVQAAQGRVEVDTAMPCDHLAAPGVVGLANRPLVRGMMRAVRQAQPQGAA